MRTFPIDLNNYQGNYRNDDDISVLIAPLSHSEICSDTSEMEKDGCTKDSFSAKMIFALDLHLSNITDVAIITAIIFNLPSSCSSLVNQKELRTNRTAEIVPMNFKCHSPHLDQMSCGSPFPLFRLSKVFSSSPGKLSSAPVEYVRLVMQCQLHQSSVMPQRSALSDGEDILHDLPPMISLHFSGSRARQRPTGAGGFCVREAQCQVLSQLWGQKPSGTAADVGMPQHRKWLRETHSQLSAAISMSDSLATFRVTRTCISMSKRKWN